MGCGLFLNVFSTPDLFNLLMRLIEDTGSHICRNIWFVPEDEADTVSARDKRHLSVGRRDSGGEGALNTHWFITETGWRKRMRTRRRKSTVKRKELRLWLNNSALCAGCNLVVFHLLTTSVYVSVCMLQGETKILKLKNLRPQDYAVYTCVASVTNVCGITDKSAHFSLSNNTGSHTHMHMHMHARTQQDMCTFVLLIIDQ